MSELERIVIVGAGPAGLSTARAYRAHGGTAALTLVGKESTVPYRRPPLTKEFLRGEIAAGELPIESHDWFGEHDVQLRLGCTATAIDPDRGTVKLPGQTLAADAIVLATGAEPLRPDLPGLSDPRVLTIRERADSERIARQAQPGTRVIVIGTGFIGCELAASLAMVGARVTLIGQEPAPQQPRLGAQPADRIAGWLADLGVELVMDAKVCAVANGRTVHLEGARQIDGDLVLLGMGVQPRTELARDAGLTLVDGAVLTDSQMRAHERVFAVGDAAFARNRVAGRRLRVEHWGDALGHGEVAGRVLAGRDAHWQDVPGFWSTIGQRTLKYAAWGDGYAQSRFVEHPGGAFTVWYSRKGKLVGVLTHERDEDYEDGRERIRAGDPAP